MKVARPAADDDQLTETTIRTAERWNLVLVWFMRILSLVWIVKGLGAWATILAITGTAMPFETATSGFQAAKIYFAVIDLVAGVGLWLASAWGGILWLLAVMSHFIIAVFFPRFVSNSALTISLLIVSIALYLTISWLAAIDE